MDMDEEELFRRYHADSKFSFGGLDKVKDSENKGEAPSTGDANNVPSSATNIPQFDEQSGARLTAEEDVAIETPTTKREVLVLPWREWHRENTLGALEADKASAVAVLHGLHENFDVTIQPVEVNYINNKPRVFATTIIEKGMVWLPQFSQMNRCGS